MKRFILTVVVCASLLGLLSSLLYSPTSAAENPLLVLLNLPAPPPPNPQVSLSSGEFAENFFSKTNPPADDDSIEALMAYWRRQSQGYGELQYKVYPSDKVLDRLMREIEKDPSQLVDFLNIFPRNDRSGNFVRAIYDRAATGSETERESRSRLRQWLKYNTSNFSSELAQEAGKVTDQDDYVTNHRALIALARVDWDRANSIVSRLYNNPGQPASRAAALWAMYVHAMESGGVGDVDRYRDELKAIVADKSQTAGVRDLALDAISLEKDFPGRDEWYLSLLEDETLTDLGRFTGLTTLISNSPEGKYVDRMIALLDSDNINVRTAAAQNLMDRLDTRREDIVKALIRWLDNPKWLKQTQRSARMNLITALAQVKVPESVPGLIAALDEMEQRAIPRYTYGSNSNMANMAANVAVRRAVEAMVQAVEQAAYAANATNSPTANSAAMPSEAYPHLRSSAIEALAFQKDPRAVPALRRILNEATNTYGNQQLVKAIYDCGGFSTGEQLAAVEVAAKSVTSEMAALEAHLAAANVDPSGLVRAVVLKSAMEGSALGKDDGSRDSVTLLLGAHLMSESEVSDDLARAVIDRITSVERTDPSLADALRKVAMNWQGTVINALLLRDLKKNKTDSVAIVRLLSVRKELREKQIQDVSDLRTGSAIGVGISSCLLEDPNDMDSMLDAPGDELKTSLLACARLIRAPLSVPKVVKLLESKDKLLALAAERYLESEDSRDARNAVLALHAGQAKILGATTAFHPDGSIGEAALATPFLHPLFGTVSPYFAQDTSYFDGYSSPEEDVETGLQNEVKQNTELLGIYSLEENSIRIYKDKAVLNWVDDPARYRERVLTKEEFDNFKGLLAHYKADDLPPFLSCFGSQGCQSRRLVMVGRNGGRRVFVKSRSMPPLFAELDRMFLEFRQPPSVIKYVAAETVPGLEVLFADDRLAAQAVWKSGADFRLLTADKVRRVEIDNELENFAENLPDRVEIGEDTRMSNEKTRREYENYSWNIFADGAIGAVVSQPPDVEFIPVRDNLDVSPSPDRWKAKAGAVEIRFDSKALYKLIAGKLTKIKAGNYSNPVVTPNGRWVVATKYDDNVGAELVRINLLTNREYKVKSPEESPAFRPIAFVPALNRMLVGPFGGESDYFDEEEGSAPDDGTGYSLLDPETGVAVLAKGEVRPFVHQSFRPLQPAKGPFEFWAAIPKDESTVIGIYNTRFLTMKPMLTLPKITFDSMNIWVDEPGEKVYFVYEGHLLAAPLGSLK